MLKPPIIGLCGPYGSGKTTAQQLLWTNQLYIAAHFATKGKAILKDLYDFSWQQVYGSNEEKEAIDPRYGFSSRYAMERFMTEVARSIHPDTWLWYVQRTWYQQHKPLLCIDDVRFPNEAEWILKEGGEVWELSRIGYPYTELHSANHPLPGQLITRTIPNNGTAQELEQQINKLLES